MVGLTPVSRPLEHVILSLPLYHLPLHSLLFQSSIERASQSFSKGTSTQSVSTLPLDAPHVPPLYLPKPISVSHNHSHTHRVLNSSVKLADFPLLGPLSVRFPWPMTKAMASVSVGVRELVLLVSSSPSMPSAPLTRPTLLSANAADSFPGRSQSRTFPVKKSILGH